MTILKPYIYKQLQGQIWKLIIDSLSNRLFIETRDADKHLALFYSLDMEGGVLLFQDLVQHEEWLTGMAGSFNGLLFLHGYQSPQSPVHKGITVIDGANGNVLWNNYTYAIHHISINGPVAFNIQVHPPKLFLLNAQNGATLRAYDPSIDTEIRQDIAIPQVTDSLNKESRYHIEGKIVGNIHSMNYNSFRIVSLHSLIKDVLSQLLLIMQGDKLVYYDLLNDKIQKLQPEAFMMHRNQLIYIKNKAELKVLNL